MRISNSDSSRTPIDVTTCRRGNLYPGGDMRDSPRFTGGKFPITDRDPNAYVFTAYARSTAQNCDFVSVKSIFI